METAESAGRQKKSWVGKVVSNKMDKTVVVLVQTKVKHPKYEKYITRHKKFYAHDAENTCELGDQVVIEESRPLSRLKRWTVREVRVRASAA